MKWPAHGTVHLVPRAVPEHDEQVVCSILERMTPEHWEALEYVRNHGQAGQFEATADLVQWGAVARGKLERAVLTANGRQALIERNP